MTALIRLYPADFRREFGDELAEAHRAATDGAGTAARLREGADIAGHALRLRLGLGSAGRAGQRLAAWAPFALLAVGANALCWTRLLLQNFRAADGVADLGPALPLMAAAFLVTALGAALALTGRWTAGAWTALAGILANVAVEAARSGSGALEFAGLFGGLPLLLALVALLCPPDLRPAPRVRTTGGVVAVLAWTLVLAAVLTACPLPHPLGALRFVVPVAGGLILAGRASLARLRTAPAVLLAGLPLLAIGVLNGALGLFPLAPLFGGLLLAAAAVSLHRRRTGGRNPLTGA
ncbi:hypothetical protein AB0C77_21600 [Streptomyces sp. NPDC048629]|uniref:hypothetical protein n=1 Tax=Streptomyces sp. NPDC048629 TaxID=3154824 RepID=UPI0034325E64